MIQTCRPSWCAGSQENRSGSRYWKRAVLTFSACLTLIIWFWLSWSKRWPLARLYLEEPRRDNSVCFGFERQKGGVFYLGKDREILGDFPLILSNISPKKRGYSRNYLI